MAPQWGQPGIGARAATRITEADYKGQATTPEQYLLESIVNPSAFMVSGFQPVMPGNYGQTLTAQETANLIAYLLSIK